jgi:Tol biopolymer transport system component
VQRFTFALVSLGFLLGCSTPSRAPSVTTLSVFRLEPAGLVELGVGNSTQRELPISVPDGCTVDNIFAPPVGATLAIELSCAFGQAVVWLDTDTGKLTQPVTDSDSHFMGWIPDGSATFLKVDTVNRPHVILAHLGGMPENVPITELSYDISPRPDSQTEFLFTFSRGMGLGSEMWLARFDGRLVKQVMVDPSHYLSFARWSPDGSKVAFIKIPDSATPFTVGELWIMEADGSQAHRLAEADAGHGYAEAWSPDGARIAFVVRENPNDAQADTNAEALKSNISILNVADGTQTGLTHLQDARVGAPAWSPDGNSIAFTAVLNDKMAVYVADITSGELKQAIPGAACCAVWLRK